MGAVARPFTPSHESRSRYPDFEPVAPEPATVFATEFITVFVTALELARSEDSGRSGSGFHGAFSGRDPAGSRSVFRAASAPQAGNAPPPSFSQIYESNDKSGKISFEFFQEAGKKSTAAILNFCGNAHAPEPRCPSETSRRRSKT